MSRDPQQDGDAASGPPLDPTDEAFVRLILARHAATGPIPDDVALRLDAALAAAAAAREVPAAASIGDRLPAASRVSPLRRLSRPARLLLVAAAGASVLVGGFVFTRPGSGEDQQVAGSAGAAAQSDDAPQSDAAGPAPAEAAREALSGPMALLPGAVTASGRDYSVDSLPAAAALLLGERTDPPEAAAPLPSPGGLPDRALDPSEPLAAPGATLGRLGDGLTLGLCAQALAGGGSPQVLAADLARYQGQPAAVIVLPTPDEAVLDVWVVGPGCAPGDTRVLARTSVPRP